MPVRVKLNTMRAYFLPFIFPPAKVPNYIFKMSLHSFLFLYVSYTLLSSLFQNNIIVLIGSVFIVVEHVFNFTTELCSLLVAGNLSND